MRWNDGTEVSGKAFYEPPDLWCSFVVQFVVQLCHLRNFVVQRARVRPSLLAIARSHNPLYLCARRIPTRVTSTASLYWSWGHCSLGSAGDAFGRNVASLDATRSWATFDPLPQGGREMRPLMRAEFSSRTFDGPNLECV